jgi:predicted transposase/invertase (TIGR01784 family)
MESIRRREMDDRYRMEAALEEAVEKGMEKGMKKGMEKERLKNAKAMKAKGLDVNTIAEVTGLTVDDILKM